jgi:hypothetical protein
MAGDAQLCEVAEVAAVLAAQVGVLGTAVSCSAPLTNARRGSAAAYPVVNRFVGDGLPAPPSVGGTAGAGLATLVVSEDEAARISRPIPKVGT